MKTEPEQHDAYRAKLRELKSEVSVLEHDLNNPLSIISGNTHFMLQVAATMELGEDFLGPLRDIERATRQMHAIVDRLSALKERLEPEQRPFSA